MYLWLLWICHSPMLCLICPLPLLECPILHCQHTKLIITSLYSTLRYLGAKHGRQGKKHPGNYVYGCEPWQQVQLNLSLGRDQGTVVSCDRWSFDTGKLQWVGTCKDGLLKQVVLMAGWLILLCTFNVSCTKTGLEMLFFLMYFYCTTSTKQSVLFK